MTEDDKAENGPGGSADGQTEEKAKPRSGLTAAQAIEVARAAAAEAAAESAESADAAPHDDKETATDSAPVTQVDPAVETPEERTGTVSDGESAVEPAEIHPEGRGEASAGDVAAPAEEPAPATAPPAPSAAAAGTPPPTAAAPAAESASASKPLATPIAWLALVLVLLLAAAGFTQLLELQRREASLLQRVQGLESVSGQDTTTFDQMRDNLSRQIELELEGIAARQTRAEEDQQRALQRIEGLVEDRSSALRGELGRELGSLRNALEAQEQMLREQQQRLGDLSVEDRKSWQLAEVQYLLRLANQRLIMTGDTESAEALMRSADNILRDVDDAKLRGLREALASDLAAVRAVPRLDTQGLYLRLGALIGQTDALVLFELPTESPDVEAAPAEDWRGRLAQGFETAVAKLSEYIVVSRRDVPVESLMDPQYEGLVRQNMRMLLEQAQVAMLSGNEVLYRQSLERAEGWVTQFFKEDQRAAQAMTEELALLRDERVSVELPDLSASLSALAAAMKARLAAGEA
ncbi:MAG: uroporphyrinogen-III C-methyltransferase [Halieaceae bacterium]|nr:uroporphyrinogen-III C-methyltransferase [Halieaceae bacterium]